MESLFLLAFGEEEFLAALGMTGSGTFFNKLLKKSLADKPTQTREQSPLRAVPKRVESPRKTRKAG